MTDSIATAPSDRDAADLRRLQDLVPETLKTKLREVIVAGRPTEIWANTDEMCHNKEARQYVHIVSKLHGWHSKTQRIKRETVYLSLIHI